MDYHAYQKARKCLRFKLMRAIYDIQCDHNLLQACENCVFTRDERALYKRIIERMESICEDAQILNTIIKTDEREAREKSEKRKGEQNE